MNKRLKKDILYWCVIITTSIEGISKAQKASRPEKVDYHTKNAMWAANKIKEAIKSLH